MHSVVHLLRLEANRRNRHVPACTTFGSRPSYLVLHAIERIVAPRGLRVDATSPWVDARLPAGSRVQT
jgi:Flp pilus assembly CpaF family ATPase